MGNSPDSIDTWGELQDLFVYVTLFMVAGLVLGAAVITANPQLDEQLRYRVTDLPNYTGGGELVFTRDQIEHLNKAYRESHEEQGRCLEIDDTRVDKLRYPLDTENDTPTHTTFTCPEGTNGIVHTHPGVLAIPELSQTDKDTILENGLDVSCVISEPIPADVTQNPVSMNCFNTQIQKLAITIDDGEVA